MRHLLPGLCCIALASALNATASAQSGVDRLLQGEVLYESLLNNHLDALLKLNPAQLQNNDRDLLDTHERVELQLAYGLSNLTQQALKPRSANKQDRHTLNQAAYQLAWYYYHQHQPANTLQSLDMIKGRTEEISPDDVLYLRALAYIGVGKLKDATRILDSLPAAGRKGNYIQYNLALAQLLRDNEELGRSTLDSLGRVNSSDEDILALKDMANLKLGYRYLQSNELEQAKRTFSRIRLDGPFTNQALLGSGWTSFSMGQIKRAIVAWTVLHEKPAINQSVIEAKMALPYAYSKLGAYGKAANLYVHAIKLFETETARLDTAMKAIANAELRQAILDGFDYQGDDWYIELSLRQPQQQLYLPLLLQNDSFNRHAASLHQLAVIKNRIEQAQSGIAALRENAKLKQRHYASVNADAEKELRAIYQKLKALMQQVPQQPGSQQSTIATIPELGLVQTSYNDFLRMRNATADYQQQLPGYSRQLSELSNKLKQLDKKLDNAIADTGKQMESAALETLDEKRKQLDGYRSNALFALAESYDFATGKQQ